MRWLLFLSRLAFICGFAFVLSFASLFFKQIENQELLQTLITIGFVMGAVVLPISLLSYLVLMLAGKKPGTVVPKWIVIANILFLLLLFTYIFYLNDPYYYKR
jgi:CBS domain containing-hemolysin-like protein